MKKLICVIFIVFISSASYAQSKFGFDLGTEYGFGLKGSFGSPKTQFEVGGGLLPVFSYFHVNYIYIGGGSGPSDEDYFNIYLSGAIGAKINIALNNPEKDNRLGLKFGASYNTILQAGFGGGVDYVVSKKPKNIVISGGVMIYPNAYDELLERLNEKEGTSFTKDDLTATFTNVMPFVSVTIFFGE